LYSFEEAIAMQSWSSGQNPASPSSDAASSDAAFSAPAPREPKRLPEKLGPDRVARMRELVEGTDWSYRRIAGELGLSVATVSRYATEGGWRRPPAQAPSSPSESRQRIAEKLWRLAERHAEALEDQPIAQAQRALQPLARLTRTLGEMDKHAHAPLATGQYEIDTKPRRSLHEMRDELVAHLERIEREEREYEERYRWTFENGAGI
jgi:predicted transcriptional regulator